MKSDNRTILRSPELMRRRKRRRILRWTIFSVTVVLLVVIFAVLTHLSNFSIQNVNVNGNQAVSSSDIKNKVESILAGSYGGFLPLIPKKNIIFYPKENIKSELLADFNRLGSVSIGRTSFLNFTSIDINVTERKPIAIWCDQINGATVSDTANCYYIDYTGLIFTSAPHFSGNAYVVYSGSPATTTATNFASNIAASSSVGSSDIVATTTSLDLSGSVFLSQNKFTNIQNALKGLKDIGFDTTTVLHRDDDYICTTLGGVQIIFNDQQPFSTSISTLQNILSQHSLDTFSSIDLRFGNKVFYRLAGQGALSASATSTLPASTSTLPLKVTSTMSTKTISVKPVATTTLKKTSSTIKTTH